MIPGLHRFIRLGASLDKAPWTSPQDDHRPRANQSTYGQDSEGPRSCHPKPQHDRREEPMQPRHIRVNPIWFAAAMLWGISQRCWSCCTMYRPSGTSIDELRRLPNEERSDTRPVAGRLAFVIGLVLKRHTAGTLRPEATVGHEVPRIREASAPADLFGRHGGLG